MPSKDPAVKKSAALRYYYRNREKVLAQQTSKRRAAGVEPRKPGMTKDERREYERLRAEKKRREAGIKPRTKRSPEAEREAARLRQEKRRSQYVSVRKPKTVSRARAGAATPREIVSAPAPAPARSKQAPAVVRNGWAKADKNSAIRRRWPTAADLQRAADEGAFDDVRTYI